MTDDTKRRALEQHGVLHPHPDRVTDPRFADDPFFDPRDLLQVKYEMLRRTRVEGATASAAASEAGLSRPTFYKAKEDFQRAGVVGLLPAKKGPRSAHKLSGEVMAFVDERRGRDASLSYSDLARLVLERFGVSVHPRSIERALASRREEKGGA